MPSGPTPDRRARRDASTPATTRLDRLRALRAPRERAEPLGAALETFRRQLEQREQSIGPVQRAWNETIPEELARASTIVGLRRGTLTIRIADNSARFATDRLLRAGGELRVLRRCPRTVRRIRLIP
ncbi:MAG: DciA family protein [Phycisphaerales bacterium]